MSDSESESTSKTLPFGGGVLSVFFDFAFDFLFFSLDLVSGFSAPDASINGTLISDCFFGWRMCFSNKCTNSFFFAPAGNDTLFSRNIDRNLDTLSAERSISVVSITFLQGSVRLLHTLFEITHGTSSKVFVFAPQDNRGLRAQILERF